VNNLPSKKILSLLVIVGGLVVATIITFGKNTSGEAIQTIGNLFAGEKIKIPENILWQNELSKLQQEFEPIEIQNATTSNTMTDKISQSFMANYLSLKQSGTLDQTSAQTLIDQTLGFIEKSGGTAVTSLKLKIVPDKGKKSMIEYGERLGTLLRSNKPKNVQNELEIIQTAVTQKNKEKINDLDAVIATYKKIAEEMKNMPVPKTFVKAHTDMINGTIGMSLALKEMETVFDDPFRGLAGMQTYQESGSIFMQALQSTSLFIYQSQITYKQGSGGYYLLYGI